MSMSTPAAVRCFLLAGRFAHNLNRSCQAGLAQPSHGTAATLTAAASIIIHAGSNVSSCRIPSMVPACERQQRKSTSFMLRPWNPSLWQHCCSCSTGASAEPPDLCDGSHARPPGANDAALTQHIKATCSFQQLLQLVQQHSAAFNTIHLSAAYSHAAQLVKSSRAGSQQELPILQQQLLSVLHQHTQELTQGGSSRALANIIHACAHLGCKHTAQLLLPHYMEVCLLPSSSAQGVSNVAWACAVLRLQLTEQQHQQLRHAFMLKLPQATAHGISMMLWATADTGQQLPQHQLQQVLAALMPLLPEATPQAISMSVWAVAEMQQQLSPEHLQLCLQRLQQQLPNAAPQAISNTLSAVADMGLQLSTPQLQRLVDRFTQQLHHATPQGVANLLWAVGHMRWTPHALLEKLEQQHQQQHQHQQQQHQDQQQHQQAPAVDAQALANMAWACGQLGYSSKVLPGAWLQQGTQQLQQDSKACSLGPQALCNLCWAAAVLDLQEYVAHVLQLSAGCSARWQMVTGPDLRQLYQVHLWLLDSKLPAPGLGLSGVLTEQQLQQCKDSWEQLVQQHSNVSNLQRQVFDAALRLPPGTWQQPPVLEQLTDDRALCIDIAGVTAAGECVAMELDGQHHFMLPGPTLDGPSRSRGRALRARGYSVISIPHWEWECLRIPQHQESYLLRRLAEVSTARAPPAQQQQQQQQQQGLEEQHRQQ